MNRGAWLNMCESVASQLVPAYEIRENGVQRRPRLLLIQPLVGIGDMIWHKPWIDHLAAHYDVILATKPTVKARLLFDADHAITDFLMIERSMRGKRGKHDGLIGFFRMVAAFRAVKADLCLVLHHSARYTLAARMAGIAERWGYGIGSSARWLNRGRFLGRDARYQHPSAKMADFAAMNGFAPERAVWRIRSTPQGIASTTAFLRRHDINDTQPVCPIISIGVGAMDEERLWPAANFARLIARMSNELPDIAFVLIGSPDERPLIESVVSDLPDAERALIAVEPLDMAVDLLRRSLLFVGNDSGLLNIAAACERPAIGLFAQSPPLDYNPNIKAVTVPDGRFGVPGHINTITPDQVFDVVKRELSGVTDVACHGTK
jgi:heptosyltransferase-2